MKGKKKSRLRHFIAALIILAVLGCGGWYFLQVADTMQAGTRSGQVLAAFSVQDGVAVYTLLGREGEIDLAALQAGFAECCSSLPSGGRMLVWGVSAADALWQQLILPGGTQIAQQYFAITE